MKNEGKKKPEDEKAKKEKEKEESEDQETFGILPNRNLKKNLGCGG